MRTQALLFALGAAALAVAEEGSVNGPTSSQQAAGYNCDPNKCKLPSCHCASTSPPGGLSPVSLFFLGQDHKIFTRIP
jgi:hypothetical protein